MMSEYRYVSTISIKFKVHRNVATSTFYLTFSKALNIWKNVNRQSSFLFLKKLQIKKKITLTPMRRHLRPTFHNLGHAFLVGKMLRKDAGSLGRDMQTLAPISSLDFNIFYGFMVKFPLLL